MSSSSRRKIVATATQPVSPPARDTGPSAEISEEDIAGIGDRSTAPVDEEAPGGEVDFDTAIAEVLLTLAADRGIAEDGRALADRQTAAAPSRRERRVDQGLGDEALSDDGADGDDPGDEDEALDPEALLAAEAATFRLLSELDRLWHRAA